MNKTDADRIRRRLLELRQEVEAMLVAAGDAAQIVELDQARVGRLSRMDAMQAQAMSQASGRRRQLMQQQIDAALARLEQGLFGICASCDEPIHPQRLEFDPTVVLCIDCAAKVES